jgi:hypothetical protein
MVGWREQVRFGKKVQVPPMEEWAVLVHDPLDCYQIGLRFYSGAVIDTLALNCWAHGTRFQSGDLLYEVISVDESNSVLVEVPKDSGMSVSVPCLTHVSRLLSNVASLAEDTNANAPSTPVSSVE